MKLRMAMLFAKDMERMTRFYRDALGLVVLPEESSEGWVVMETEGCRFALHAIPAPIASSIVIEEPPVARVETPIKLIFEVENLEAARAHVERHGAVLLPERMPGARDFLDPEGNVVQIAVGGD